MSHPTPNPLVDLIEPDETFRDVSPGQFAEASAEDVLGLSLELASSRGQSYAATLIGSVGLREAVIKYFVNVEGFSLDRAIDATAALGTPDTDESHDDPVDAKEYWTRAWLLALHHGIDYPVSVDKIE